MNIFRKKMVNSQTTVIICKEYKDELRAIKEKKKILKHLKDQRKIKKRS